MKIQLWREDEMSGTFLFTDSRVFYVTFTPFTRLINQSEITGTDAHTHTRTRTRTGARVYPTIGDKKFHFIFKWSNMHDP